MQNSPECNWGNYETHQETFFWPGEPLSWRHRAGAANEKLLPDRSRSSRRSWLQAAICCHRSYDALANYEMFGRANVIWGFSSQIVSEL